MIKFTDAALLALAKLRAYKIRTAVTVLLASLLFSVLISASLILTGAFSSLDNFRSDGLTGRYIISVTPSLTGDAFSGVLSDPALVAEARARYTKLVQEKMSEAVRLGVDYTQAADQPPYTESGDGRTAMLNIRDANGISQELLEEKFKNQPVLDESQLEATAKRYNAIKLFTSTHYTVRSGSTLEAFRDGKEIFYDKSDEAEMNNSYRPSLIDGGSMVLAPSDITNTFMLPNNAGWQPDGTSMPIILPQNNVEQFLDIAPPADTASAGDKITHLERIYAGAAALSFKACYRNDASNDLIQKAVQQQKEIEVHIGDKEYIKPSVIYELPASDTCEDPRIVADTRTTEEKKRDDNQREFDQKFGVSTEPVSYFVNFKLVGISPTQSNMVSDTAEEQANSVDDIIDNLLKVSGVGQVVPQELYDQMQNQERYVDLLTYVPLYIFGNEDNKQRFVEFSSADDAQKFIDEQSCVTQVDSTCHPTGRLYQARLAFSNSAALEDIRAKVSQWSMYAMFGVIILAAVVMWITIGRTITGSRRETAVFRAIGFKRIDIASIYTIYTIILSLLVALLAMGLGIIIALLINHGFALELTAQARYSFGGSSMSKEIVLLGVNQIQLGIILLACLITGIFSLAAPLLRNVRRNPIRDMREE